MEAIHCDRDTWWLHYFFGFFNGDIFNDEGWEYVACNFIYFTKYCDRNSCHSHWIFISKIDLDIHNVLPDRGQHGIRHRMHLQFFIDIFNMGTNRVK